MQKLMGLEERGVRGVGVKEREREERIFEENRKGRDREKDREIDRYT